MNDVQQAIDDARNAGNALEIEAGRQMLVVIAQAQAVYADQLNKTVSQLDSVASGNINHMATEVATLRTGTVNDLKAMESQAQTIVSLLPFREHEPKLGQTLPRFAAPTATIPNIRFRFAGSFEFAGRPEFAPSLRIGGSELPPIAVTDQVLEFLVTQADLLAAADPKKVTFVIATLTVPWESTFLFFFHTRNEDKYPVLLGVLPTVPGDIKIVQFFKTHDPVVKHYKGPNHHLSSQREDGNRDRKDVRSSDNADPGCEIDRASVRQIGNGHGAQSYGLVSIDASTVVSTATTIHQGGLGVSGVNDYWIEFDEQCKDTQDREETTIINDSTKSDLRWGDSRSYNLRPEAHYRVIFDSFDGKHNEYQDPVNGLLVVGSDTAQVTVSTANPASIVWP